MAKRFGVMLDMSRNAVMKTEQVKKYADTIKKLGYNMILLYTEDTYEVDGEPYFGYLRGRYTKDELKEMVNYCDSIGVELIPCIQTLAHLNQIFYWQPYQQICDLGDILLVEEDRTYQLIENMFKTLRECYTSDIIHIGMDEAHMLGLGRYRDKHGEKNRFEILHKHLEKVIEIAKKYNFKPIMWSDMFFRLANNGTYFLEAPSPVTENLAVNCPDGVEQVYWDYYSNRKGRYDTMLDAHAQFKGELWFGGGAWSWNGFGAGNALTIENMTPAITSCKERNVDNIFMTMWGDNGKECSFWSLLPSLFAVRKIYDGVTDMDIIKKEFKERIGEDYDNMMLLDLPVTKPDGKIIDNSACKFYLYNDAFLGFLDPTLTKDYKEDYLELEQKLLEDAKNFNTTDKTSEEINDVKDKLQEAVDGLEKAETIKSLLLGDVNSDDKINSRDYVALKRYCFKTLDFTEEQIKVGNINGDTKDDGTPIINSRDYVLLKRHCFKTYTITPEFVQ